MLKKLLFILGFILSLNISSVFALEKIKTFIPEAQEVGKGRLSYMMLNIYEATLYAPQGKWKAEEPFALRISYLIDIKGKKIADRSIVEMRKQGFTNEIKLATWHAQMRDIFPDIDDGSHLTGVYTKEQEAVFYKDDKEIGRIRDPEFSKMFFGIWLSEKTTVPKLRQKLLGLV